MSSILQPVVPQDPPGNVDIAALLQQHSEAAAKQCAADREEDKAMHRTERDLDLDLDMDMYLDLDMDLDLDLNLDLNLAIDKNVTTMKATKKPREGGRWLGLQSELPVLLTGIAVNAYLQLLLAKVVTMVRREADQEVITAALEGSANSLVGDVSADPIAQSILAAQAAAMTARLAKEMLAPVTAEPATNKPAWHKNHNKFAKAAGKGAQGAPKPA
jgi:hypothetical protein